MLNDRILAEDIKSRMKRYFAAEPANGSAGPDKMMQDFSQAIAEAVVTHIQTYLEVPATGTGTVTGIGTGTGNGIAATAPAPAPVTTSVSTTVTGTAIVTIPTLGFK